MAWGIPTSEAISRGPQPVRLNRSRVGAKQASGFGRMGCGERGCIAPRDGAGQLGIRGDRIQRVGVEHQWHPFGDRPRQDRRRGG